MNTWKPVRGFPLYEISNEGVVRNPKTGKLLTLKRGGEYKLSGKNISLTKLMRENFPYEWIKYLEEGEEVKPLKEYPGYYITSYGRVWGMSGYKFHSVWKDKRREYYYRVSINGVNMGSIHTLVGRNFLPEYREGLFILHKEETLSYPEINYVSNLWVGTNSDNMKDSYRKGRKKNQYMKSYIEKYPLSETY